MFTVVLFVLFSFFFFRLAPRVSTSLQCYTKADVNYRIRMGIGFNCKTPKTLHQVRGDSLVHKCLGKGFLQAVPRS